MEHRLALIVEDREHLVQGLQQYLGRGGQGMPDAGVLLFSGQAGEEPGGIKALFSGKAGEALVKELLAQRAFDKIALFWCQGGRVPWAELHRGRPPRFVRLPTYPFEQRRCWITPTDKTRYEDSFIHQEAGDAGKSAHTGLAEIIHDHVCRSLGLEPAELSMDEPLSRFELLLIFLPRLQHRLQRHEGIRLDTARLHDCQSVADLVDIVLPPEELAAG
jgi:acyl transferase domain-containing protein